MVSFCSFYVQLIEDGKARIAEMQGRLSKVGYGNPEAGVAYITHQKLAVRKFMEAMRTAHAKKGAPSVARLRDEETTDISG